MLLAKNPSLPTGLDRLADRSGKPHASGGQWGESVADGRLRLGGDAGYTENSSEHYQKQVSHVLNRVEDVFAEMNATEQRPRF